MTSLIHMERTKNNAAVRTAINRRLSPERLTVFDAVRVRKNQRKIELMEVLAMAKCKEFVYSKCRDIYDRITATAENHITIDKVYEDKQNGFKWLLNARGYLHIYRIEPCKADGKICYILQHYRLKADGNLADAGYNLFLTYAEAKKVYDDFE